jgi:hypothetical protein
VLHCAGWSEDVRAPGLPRRRQGASHAGSSNQVRAGERGQRPHPLAPRRQQYTDPQGTAKALRILPDLITRHAAEVGEVFSVDPNRANRTPFPRHMAELGYELTATTRLNVPVVEAPAWRGRLLHYRRR